MKPTLDRLMPYIVCAALVALVIIGRVVVESSRELNAGEAALARGEMAESIRLLRRAAHWYLPGNPYCAEAYQRLEGIAMQAESQGRREDASSAWRAIRASALATRWLVVPQRNRLERANLHLAALMVELPTSTDERGRDRARLREEYLALLTEDHAPEPAWVMVMGFGFVLWIAAAVIAARSGWDDDDRPKGRFLIVAGAAFSFGMALFVLGIVRA